MCIFCSQLYAGGESVPGGGAKKYKYTIEDFGVLSVKPLHLDCIFDFGPKAFANTAVGTYIYNECLDKGEKQTKDLTVIELDQNQLTVESVGVIVNNADNTLFTPANAANLLDNDWIKHRAQFEGCAVTADEEKDWSNEGKLTFTPITNFVVDQANQKLIIPLPEGVVIKPGQQFIVRTKTVAFPNDYDLEGMYFDQAADSSPDCPPQIISQNQQYGYRKITPTIDQMPSKCAYTTTVVADGRYTSIISNGDLAPGFFQTDAVTGLIEPIYHNPSSHFDRDGGDEKKGYYKNRKVVRYYLFDLMATYLFFLGLGTYISYSRDVEYPLHPEDPLNVERNARGETLLEYTSFSIDLILAPDQFDHIYCLEKLQIIRDAILWTYLAGPSHGCTDHKDLRIKINELIQQRELIKDKLGQGIYSTRANFKQISQTVGNGVVEADLALNPIVAKYQKSLSVKEGPEHMKKPVCHYYPEKFPFVNKDGTANPEKTERLQLETELEAIRKQLCQLVSSVPFDTWGHRYKSQIYREIAMHSSAYGGMENRQCTTILMSRFVPNPLLSDGAYLYLLGVTIHEYFHDLNGSLCTGQSPFTIFLNEAMTVSIQRLYEHQVFGFDLMRSNQLAYANIPSAGPLAVDSAPNAMAIVPAGFNETGELISAMTYSKAPEFCKAIERVIGTPTFYKGLSDYYKRFANSNAKTEDWIQALVDASGDQTLFQMADKWLKESGHPTVSYNGVYDAASKKYTLKLKQTGWEHHTLVTGPWRFGIEIELFGPEGQKLIKDEIKTGCSGRTIDSTPGEVFLFDMKTAEAEVVFEGIEVEPAFPSVSRGWSFFGKTVNVSPNKDAEARAQLKYDDDAITKMLAWANYKEPEVTRLTKTFAAAIKAKEQIQVTPSADWIQLHATILFDESLSPSARASILDESGAACNDPSVSFEYYAISDAFTALFQGLWASHAKALVKLYNDNNAPETRKWPLDNGFAHRPLKRHLANIFARVVLSKQIIAGDAYITPQDAGLNLMEIANTLLFESEIMSDKILGLSLGLNLIFSIYTIDSTVLDKFVLSVATPEPTPSVAQIDLKPENSNYISSEAALEFLQKAETFFIAHPTSLEMYIQVVGAISAPFGESIIRQIIEKPYFLIGSPLHSRTLVRSWSSVRGRAALTKNGLELSKFLAVKIGKVSGLSALGMFQLLGDAKKFEPERQAVIIQALEDIKAQLDPVKDLTLYGTIEKILA